jgi:hypothetical protein
LILIGVQLNPGAEHEADHHVHRSRTAIHSAHRLLQDGLHGQDVDGRQLGNKLPHLLRSQQPFSGNQI